MSLKPLKYSVFLFLAGACGEFPQLDDAVSETARDAPFPTLGPAEVLHANVAAPRITDESRDRLQQRGDALKAKGTPPPPAPQSSLQARSDALRAKAEKLKQQ